MKRGRKAQKGIALGDLIAVLFDETKKVSSNKLEQNFLVYLALKDLLRDKVHTDHPVSLTR